MKLPTPIPWKLTPRHSGHVQNLPDKTTSVVIGVLALQGDFLEHMQTLQSLGIYTQEVRLPADLENINGLIIPGGESTTMANLLAVFGMREKLIERITGGMPVWGTCAGMILLAKTLVQEQPNPLGVMNIVVNRNAFGRQRESFAEELSLPFLGVPPLHATFIRAPIIEKAGPGVEILGRLSDGRIIAAREKNMLVTAFHPELTGDTRVHEYFVTMCKETRDSETSSE